MSKWIDFEFDRQTPSGKTGVWHVVQKNGGGRLGEILWFGRWRQYVFAPDSQTVYEQDCLRDIAEFCEQRTREHRMRGERLLSEAPK